MGRVITAPGVLKNTQGQLDHLSELYQDIKDNNLKPITITLDQMQNANGAYSHTTEDDRITEGMKAIAIEVGTPESFYDQISVTTGNGTCTVSCPDAHGNSTITVTFVHTRPIDGGEDVPESVTSNEFDVLAERIGVLSNLETLANSNLVGAVNEVVSDIEEVNSKITKMPLTVTYDEYGKGTITLPSGYVPIAAYLDSNWNTFVHYSNNVYSVRSHYHTDYSRMITSTTSTLIFFLMKE